MYSRAPPFQISKYATETTRKRARNGRKKKNLREPKGHGNVHLALTFSDVGHVYELRLRGVTYQRIDSEAEKGTDRSAVPLICTIPAGRWLVALARVSYGTDRLVTTNFDLYRRHCWPPTSRSPGSCPVHNTPSLSLFLLTHIRRNKSMIFLTLLHFSPFDFCWGRL